MSFDYAELATEVAEVFREMGGEGRLTMVTTGAYDPATGTAPVSEVTVPVTCVVIDYDDEVIDGTRIQAGDKRVYMAAGAVPKPDDVFTWMGRALRVVAAKQLSPAGTNVMTELQVRG